MKKPVNPILQWLKWGLEVFSSAKSFEANPILGSRLLNTLGLHVFRLILAHAFTLFRRCLLRNQVSSAQRVFFKQHGYILIENVLSPEELMAARNELYGDWPETRYFTQGDTRTEFVFLDSDKRKGLPFSSALLQHSLVMGCLRYVSATCVRPWMDFLRIVNKTGARESDPQKRFHSDTFHPTMKAWLFLEPVTSEQGPFEYVTGSHRLTWRRLLWEYRQSKTVQTDDITYARRGSFRATEEELHSLGYNEVKAFAVPANSLVVADTYGFHRRGQAKPNTQRASISFSNRLNPFLLLPIPNLGWINNLMEREVNKHHRKTTDCSTPVGSGRQASS